MIAFFVAFQSEIAAREFSKLAQKYNVLFQYANAF